MQNNDPKNESARPLRWGVVMLPKNGDEEWKSLPGVYETREGAQLAADVAAKIYWQTMQVVELVGREGPARSSHRNRRAKPRRPTPSSASRDRRAAMSANAFDADSQQRMVSFRCLRCGAAATEAASPDLSPRTVRVEMSQCPQCERGDYYQESQYDAEWNELSIEEIAEFHTVWLRREWEAAEANDELCEPAPEDVR